MTEYLNKSQLIHAGWTPQLILKVLGSPDEVVEHKRGYQAWSEHRYRSERVADGVGSSEFQLLVARRRRRSEALLRRREQFQETYEADWRKALLPAARGLWSLNRYAKHRSCTIPYRHDIYDLKNKFMELLYRLDYCVGCWTHVQVIPAKPCNQCDGADYDCCCCGGSGVYQDERRIEHWCFRFDVAGELFAWHRPKSDTSFTPAETGPPAQWTGLMEVKPVSLAKAKFLLAKELIRWVLGQAAEAATIEKLQRDPNSSQQPTLLDDPTLCNRT